MTQRSHSAACLKKYVEPKHKRFSLSKEIGSLEGLEKQHITKLLMENDWNKTKTAQKLNISRPTLNAKIKQYGIVIEK